MVHKSWRCNMPHLASRFQAQSCVVHTGGTPALTQLVQGWKHWLSKCLHTPEGWQVEIFWKRKLLCLSCLEITFPGGGGSCHGQTDRPPDGWHHRVTSWVAPCEQQGATKYQTKQTNKKTFGHRGQINRCRRLQSGEERVWHIHGAGWEVDRGVSNRRHPLREDTPCIVLITKGQSGPPCSWDQNSYGHLVSHTQLIISFREVPFLGLEMPPTDRSWRKIPSVRMFLLCVCVCVLHI